MKVADCWKTADAYTGKASDLARQLGFAGIALIWIFTDASDEKKVPSQLIAPGAILVFALACDLIHYIISAALWTRFAREQERKMTREQEFKAPKQINWVPNAIWVIKLGAILIAYALIILFLADFV